MKKSIREKILIALSKPSSVTELKNKIPEIKSFGTLAYHLKKLLEEGVVTKNKQNKKQGKPTIYKLNSPETIKQIKEWNDKREQEKYVFLKYIKDNPKVEDNKMINDLQKQGYDVEDMSLNCVSENLSILHHSITQKGEKFLKENEPTRK